MVQELVYQTTRAPTWSGTSGTPFPTISNVGTAQGYPVNNGCTYGPDTAGGLGGADVSVAIVTAINANACVQFLGGTYTCQGDLTGITRVFCNVVGVGSGGPGNGTVIQLSSTYSGGANFCPLPAGTTGGRWEHLRFDWNAQTLTSGWSFVRTAQAAAPIILENFTVVSTGGSTANGCTQPSTSTPSSTAVGDIYISQAGEVRLVSVSCGFTVSGGAQGSIYLVESSDAMHVLGGSSNLLVCANQSTHVQDHVCANGLVDFYGQVNSSTTGNTGAHNINCDHVYFNGNNAIGSPFIINNPVGSTTTEGQRLRLSITNGSIMAIGGSLTAWVAGTNTQGTVVVDDGSNYWLSNSSSPSMFTSGAEGVLLTFSSDVSGESFVTLFGNALPNGVLAIMTNKTNKSGTVSTTNVELSAAGIVTSKTSTRMNVIISGVAASSAVGQGGTAQIVTGTGAVPANGAAVTGTLRGNPTGTNSASLSAIGTTPTPFALCANNITIATGTATYADLAFLSSSGAATFTLTNVVVQIFLVVEV
jgi:hypothetical protein